MNQFLTLPITRILPLKKDRKDRTTKAYYDHELALMRDIVAVGIRTPLKVYSEGPHYHLVSGQTRLNAARRAGLTEVPVQVLDGELSESSLLVAELTDNNMTLEFDALAMAEIYDDLMRINGWTAAELCRHVPAAKPPTVSRAMSIFENLVPSLQDKHKSGEIGFRVAYALSRLPPDQQVEEFQKVEFMSAERIEAHIGGLTRKKPKKGFKAIKVTLPGLTLIFTVQEATKARTLMELVIAALVRLEKTGFPLENLPGIVKP